MTMQTMRVPLHNKQICGRIKNKQTKNEKFIEIYQSHNAVTQYK